MKTKAHLHLPRLRSGIDEVISAKTGVSPVEYFGTLVLSDVRFLVSQPGRIRTLDNQVRNVHAWVVGIKTAGVRSQVHPFGEKMRKAIYNPYKFETFVDSQTLERVEYALAAYMVGKHVYYVPKEQNV